MGVTVVLATVVGWVANTEAMVDIGGRWGEVCPILMRSMQRPARRRKTCTPIHPPVFLVRLDSRLLINQLMIPIYLISFICQYQSIFQGTPTLVFVQ